ncbi:MAG: hypothetical protein KDE56_28795 [Anaerolineales bacterium]|nr:hypothetical protein [Anaerolineales bacterium]
MLPRFFLFSSVIFLLMGCRPTGVEAQTRDTGATRPQLGSATVTSSSPLMPMVDRGDDPIDILPCTAAANDCTLRSAITLANNSGEPFTIYFADNLMITLSAPLPPLSANNLTVQAQPGQEVHINANGLGGNVLYITGSNVVVDGLRLYGAGAGFSNVWVGGAATNVVIANNVIGDDDAPAGNCGLSELSYGGIYVDAMDGVNGRSWVWIYNNIIECHHGQPGDGITIATSGVYVGENKQGSANSSQRNVIRENAGYAVRLGEHPGNTIRNTLIHDNRGGAIFITNFNNNLLDNDIR